MAVPSDVEVRTWVHDALLLIVRQLPVIQAAVERAEGAFTGPDFSATVAALDEAHDQLTTAFNSTD
jgi:hypothetical protein